MTRTRTRTVRRFDRTVDAVSARRDELADVDDAWLAGTARRLRARLASGDQLDDLQVELYAAVSEAARRTLGLTPFRVQLYGAVVLHTGAVAEMATGEGKTLTATMPVALHALAGPAHVVTANDYLARRDAGWMAAVYNAVGLSVSHSSPGMSPSDKKAAYHADVVYTTASELGFDFLRDQLATSPDAQVAQHADRAFVLVDEIDQVLIDEARTPLIISTTRDSPVDLLAAVDAAVADLSVGQRTVDDTAPSVTELLRGGATPAETGDVIVDRADNTVHLTDDGIDRVTGRLDGRLADGTRLYDPANAALLYRLHAALEARFLMARDRDYIVSDGQVAVVDERTGRALPGRRFGRGLHEAVEVKEQVDVQPETVVQATISIQNLFRRYRTLSGMTGTAVPAADEFASIYDLDVHVVPTNREVIRVDHPDRMFPTVDAKLDAVVEDVDARRQTGQPVLVGCPSVDAAHTVSRRLDAAGVDHELLSARQPDREADQIAQAGRPGAVTVATNMAGRGTDILLGGDPDRLLAAAVDAADAGGGAAAARLQPGVEQQQAADRRRVIAAGGLYVLGTERHSSRRIDNQLRGRAGRQGEPGESRFYVSLEDDLLELFSGDGSALSWAVGQLSGDDGEATHRLMDKAIAGAQQRVDSMHFQARQTLLAYDDVIGRQRDAVYTVRQRLLEADQDEVVAAARDRAAQAAADVVDRELAGRFSEALDPAAARRLADGLRDVSGADPDDVRRRLADGVCADDLLAAAAESFDRAWQDRVDVCGGGPAGQRLFAKVARTILIKVLDRHWVELLSDLTAVKDAIGWRAVGQQDPAVEFAREAHTRFTAFASAVRVGQATSLLWAPLQVGGGQDG